MADDGGVIWQVAKFVWFNPKFLHPTIAVSGMIEMHGARCSLDPMFAEGVRTTEGIGF